MSENKKTKKDIEDSTKYGEFVSSYFGWITLDRQRQRTKEMEDMTKNK